MTVPPALSDLFFNHEPAGTCSVYLGALVAEAREFLKLLEEATGATMTISPKKLAADYEARV